MKVSIAIPAFSDETGVGAKHLNILLSTIEKQSWEDIEIVISDHSVTNLIKEVCDQYSKKDSIIYIKNNEDRGYWGANINNAMRLCSGQIIKLMQQDDLFSSPDSIKLVVKNYLFKNFKWAICGGVHTKDYETFYSRVVPRYTEDVYKGYNRLGGVSSIIIENNEDKFYFDKHLNWMGDCDYYMKSYLKYGLPTIIEEPLIIYKQWEGQFTNTLSSEIKESEVKTVIHRYENDQSI